MLTGQVIDVFNWRGPRPGEGDPSELQCTGGSHWLAAWGAAPAVLVGFPLQCGTALFDLWGTSGHVRRLPVVMLWPAGSQLRDTLPVLPRQQNGVGERE